MIFVGMRERTSGMSRGVQLCQQKKSEWRFFQSGDVGLLNIKNEIIIFIRAIDNSLVKLLKRNNNVIVYDLLDRPVADQHQHIKQHNSDVEINWTQYINNDIDFFIVNNSLVKNKLVTLGMSPDKVYVIPHHTVNYESDKIKINETVKAVGYVGLPDQISHYNEIKTFLENRNIKFISEHPSTREQVSDVIKHLDLGIIFVDDFEKSSLSTKYILNYKPNVKLSNFQSFGVPTVACEYASYVEFGGKDSWLKSPTKNDFFQNLDFLINDSTQSKNVRKELSHNSYQNAKSYHIDEIIGIYETLEKNAKFML